MILNHLKTEPTCSHVFTFYLMCFKDKDNNKYIRLALNASSDSDFKLLFEL